MGVGGVLRYQRFSTLDETINGFSFLVFLLTFKLLCLEICPIHIVDVFVCKELYVISGYQLSISSSFYILSLMSCNMPESCHWLLLYLFVVIVLEIISFVSRYQGGIKDSFLYVTFCVIVKVGTSIFIICMFRVQSRLLAF